MKKSRTRRSPKSRPVTPRFVKLRLLEDQERKRVEKPGHNYGVEDAARSIKAPVHQEVDPVDGRFLFWAYDTWGKITKTVVSASASAGHYVGVIRSMYRARLPK